MMALSKPSTAVKLARLMWAQKLPVALVVVLIGLLSWGTPRLMAKDGGEAVGGDSYQMHRGGPERRGWQPAGSADRDPTSGGIIWRQDSVAPTFVSSPALAGAHVFIASVKLTPFADHGAILCLDAKTGKVVWQDGCGDMRSTYSSPAVCGEYVVCGEGLHTTDNARIVCLDRRSGRRLWTHRVSNHHGVEASPCIVNNKVYVGGGYDGFYCLQLKPGADGNPVIVWHKDHKAYPDTESSPVVVDGNLYFGLGIGGNALCCLDAETGAEKWRIATPYPVFSAPCISTTESKLFLTMGNGDMVNTATMLGKTEVGEVWCIDLKTHEKLWAVKTAKTVLGGCAAGRDCVYFGARDGIVYRVSMDGNSIKKRDVHAPMAACPAVAKETIYVVTEKGLLYGLNADDLTLKWEACLWTKPPADDDLFVSSPTVANGHVYVGTAKDGLLCIGEPGTPTEPIWAGYLGGNGKSGRADNSPLPGRLELAWTYPKDAADGSYKLTAPPAVLNGALYVASTDGNGPGLEKLVLNSDANQLPASAWRARSANPITLSPAVKGQSVYFVDGRQGDNGRQLHALATDNGRQRWSIPVDSGAGGDILLAGNQLITANLANGLSAIALDGKDAGQAQWSRTCGACVGAPAVSEGRVAVAVKTPSLLVLLDALTGGELWGRALEGEAVCGPLIAGEAIYVATDRGVAAYALLDGQQQWLQKEAGRAEIPLALAEGRLYCYNSEKQLVSLDAAGGKIVKSIGGVTGDSTPMLSRDGLCFTRESGLIRAALDGSKQKPWLRLQGIRLDSPQVFLDSHVYVGTNRGLACFKGL